MVNLWGPSAFGGANAAATRPDFTPLNGAGDADDFAKDCSSPAAFDGTEWRAALLNALIVNMRSVVRASGVADDNLDDALLMRAIRSSGSIYIQAGGTANALTATFPTQINSYAQLRLMLLVAVQANTRSGVTFAAPPLAARPIKRRGGGVLRRGDIQPGPVILIDAGSHYEIVGGGGAGRTLLQANLTLYVAPTGNDTLNDGLDAAAPFLTLQRAWSEIVNNYDLNGYVATVEIADGTYTAGVTATGSPQGANSGTGSVIFKSTSGNAASLVVGVTGSNAFTAQGGAQFTLQNFTVQTAGAGTSCLVATTGGLIAHTGMRFGASVLAHMNAANGGFIQATGNYTIAGNASFHAVGSSGGQVSLAGRTVTLASTPAFSSAFAYSQQGRVDATGAVYSGGATGSRYLAVENGVVTTGGAGASALPGNAVGSVASGGQYV
ncbi:hypothetical protein ABIE41_003845 [Bosea sp. OAE506]|uniref:hypothetical protein n=1 Tax=Bosea sp. OAE506 TaxID=2663870 RepID=UPI00178B7883